MAIQNCRHALHHVGGQCPVSIRSYLAVLVDECDLLPRADHFEADDPIVEVARPGARF